jgi:hypothetical protein
LIFEGFCPCRHCRDLAPTKSHAAPNGAHWWSLRPLIAPLASPPPRTAPRLPAFPLRHGREMAERRAESYAWDEEEEAVRVHIVQQLGPALAAQVSDTMMMRFIRGYYYEEPRAENTLAILRETLQWRQRTGVESMIDEPDEMLLRQSMTYRNLFHLDIYGRDSTGHVIMCQVSAPPCTCPRLPLLWGSRHAPRLPLCLNKKDRAVRVGCVRRRLGGSSRGSSSMV